MKRFPRVAGLTLHLDCLGKVLGERALARIDDRDRLTDVARLVGRQRVPGNRAQARTGDGDGPDFGGQVATGHPTAVRYADRNDAGVGKRAPDEGGFDTVAKPEVGDERAATREPVRGGLATVSHRPRSSTSSKASRIGS